MDAPERGALMLVRLIGVRSSAGQRFGTRSLWAKCATQKTVPVEIIPCVLKSFRCAGVVMLIKARALAEWISTSWTLSVQSRVMPGYLSIVLHAHLPFVRHPEHEKFLEESWLFEAITETYLPLIQISKAGGATSLTRGSRSRSRPRSARCCSTRCCASATPASRRPD
jgi:hypothetical protein